ncbi:MAG TPA: lyase family protein [Actinospica sp.]|nr:lyase family protein [Actinospica sp.]
MSDAARHLDAGLLSPVRAGTPTEAATSDPAYLQAMLDAEAALARAQARLGVVPRPAAEAITRAADAANLDPRAIALAARETANPVVGLIRAFTDVVARSDPAAAEYVHRGSTSQDVFDTAEMLVAARTLSLINADLERSIAALGRLAEQHRDTAMAGRTLALHAVPTTFGLKAAGWRQLLQDANARLTEVADRLPVSLGGAAGTLSGYIEFARIDGYFADPAKVSDDDISEYVQRLTEAFAQECGLAEPRLPWHTLRAPIADLGGALSFAAGALGKLAVDVQTLARTEVAELAEPGPSTRGASSAMPQKRNPVLSTLIRSAALQVPALATALTQSMLAEDERSAGGWQAEWALLRECLRLAGGAAHTAVELTSGLRVHQDRMRENLRLTDGQIVAERLVAVFTPVLGKPEARTLLNAATAEVRRTGAPLSTVLAEADVMDVAELDLLCDPAAFTAAAPALVDRALG